MKSLTLCAGLAALLLAACGTQNAAAPCAGSHAATWTGTTVADSVTFSAACTFSYTGASGCQSAGTYPAPLGSSGSVAITIASVSGAGCLPVGATTCAYTLSATALAFDCGAGAFSYSKTRR